MDNMPDFDPTKREYINISPLERFHEDMRDATSFYDLYTAFTKYLSNEFGIAEVNVGRIFDDARQYSYLPNPDLFEVDPEGACEKMRLALLRIAYPLAEDFIVDDTAFTDWVTRTVEVAMDIGSSRHEVDACLSAPRTYTDSPYSCMSSAGCPVIYAKQILVKDSLYIDLNTPDYYPEWRDAKIRRNLAKLDAACTLGLTQPREDETLRMNYLRACRTLPVTPKITD